jgi:hypothetical protein
MRLEGQVQQQDPFGSGSFGLHTRIQRKWAENRGQDSFGLEGIHAAVPGLGSEQGSDARSRDGEVDEGYIPPNVIWPRSNVAVEVPACWKCDANAVQSCEIIG